MDGEIRQDELTLEDILRIFKKHIWWFVATLIGIVALTVAYLIVATPIYEASVTINIEPRTKSTLTDLFSATGYIGSKPDIATEVELIKSRTNIEKVVENLNLLSYFREKMNIKNGELTTYDVVNMIAKMITVTTVKDTSIVKVSVQNPDPELAKNLANELANVYNEMLQKFSKNEYTARRMFIESQIPKVEQELKQVEDELKRFKEKNKIYVLDVEAQNLLNTVYQLDTQINNYKIQIEETKAKIAAITEQLKRTNQKVVSSETISINPVVAQLRAKLADLQIQLAGLLNTYSENDERVKTVRNQIDETERMLKSQIEKVITSQVETINPNYSELYNQLIQANTTLQMLNSSIAAVERMRDSYSSKIAQLPAVEQQLLQLERDRKVKETLYSVLLEKLEETKISEAGVIGRATIIDPAITPTVPVKPNKKLTLAVGGVLGIFLGILMVFLREAFDKTISDEEYVKQVLKDAPVLGRIPEVEFPESSERPELVVINLPTSPQAEALKLTATNIEYSTTPAPKIIAITSSGPREGKTFIAANIALSYAQNGVKTLLLDFDMRKPRIEKVLGIERINVGVSNHILKDVPLDRIITKYQENLDIIPVGPIPPNPTALLTSKKLEELVATLRTMYDRIVIDLPPILAAADALIVSKLVDGLVLVIRAGKTQKSSLKVAFENIVTSSSKLLGSVINAINANQRGYYYYYYYYYTEEGKKMKRKKRHKK
ncbi:MAG: polysaccharide biosynthesis tyrosine autokinase [Fervidobacterium sp.]|uniref:GumC family protein n=1 Tax=Fervidobacterium sp. TaxID=1871331 RepID=UPI0025BD42F2|nr:polysaccharide biosynthesis tyrosine autokinase [Fervidobacterium sp.]NPU89515.1 polysaccharide biosynthesis tyrosine autokinase [Fervidobacterium sp.]